MARFSLPSSQIDIFATYAALAARAPQTNVVYYSQTLQLDGLSAAKDKTVAMGAALIAEMALDLLEDGGHIKAEMGNLTRYVSDGRPGEAGSWTMIVARTASVDIPDPATLDLPVAPDMLRPFLSEEINGAPAVVLSATERLADGFVERFPQHNPGTVAAQILVFALVDDAFAQGRPFPIHATMDFLAARTGATQGAVLRVELTQTA